MNFRNIILLLLVSSTTIWANNDERQKNIDVILCDSTFTHLTSAGILLCWPIILGWKNVFSNEDYFSSSPGDYHHHRYCIRPYFSAIVSTLACLWSLGFTIYTVKTKMWLSRNTQNRQNGTP